MVARNRLKRSSKERLDAQVKSNRLKRIKWAANDLIQELGKIRDVPEIRVWVHPAGGGDDFWFNFENLKDSTEWSREHQHDPEYRIVEKPIVAFMGSEGTVASFKKAFPHIKLP